jgi:hypothetical protein
MRELAVMRSVGDKGRRTSGVSTNVGGVDVESGTPRAASLADRTAQRLVVAALVAVVDELEWHVEVERLDLGDDCLKVVSFLGLHPQLIALDLGLCLEFHIPYRL